MDALLNEIESTRCQISIIVALLERCSWDSEPSVRPNMLFKHLSREAFTNLVVSLNLKEVRSVHAVHFRIKYSLSSLLL